LKNHRLKAQEPAIPLCCKHGRRPAWLSRELLLELRRKKGPGDLQTQGQASQEDYRALVCLHREKTKKAKAPLELKPAIGPNNKMGILSTLVARGDPRSTLD